MPILLPVNLQISYKVNERRENMKRKTAMVEKLINQRRAKSSTPLPKDNFNFSYEPKHKV